MILVVYEQELRDIKAKHIDVKYKTIFTDVPKATKEKSLR